MKAMVLRGPNIPFELTEVPDPIAGPGEAVARVLACGSGLTIQHVKAGRIAVTFPRIIGHEIAGEIVEVGAGVTGLAVGDGVTAYYYLNCGYCRWCLSHLEPLCANTRGQVGRDCDGGYAQYIKLPAHIFIKLPAGLDYKAYPGEIGVITDALATPYKVLSRARIKAGETIAVFGAGGGLGIHQVMMAKWARARVIAIDVARDKFDACRKAGADEVIDASACDVAEALLDLTHGQGIDVAIDYVSATSTQEAGMKALGRRGRLVTLGGAGQQPFQVSAKDMVAKEQDLLGSRYVTRREILETLDLVARREVWPIVTSIRPLEEAEAVHEQVERGEITGRAALLIISFLFGILSLVLTPGAQAQSYPGRPVRVIVPYPPGAVGDIMMRTVGQRLAEILGHPFVIDNRAGGGGMAATEVVAKSAPDGYTLLFPGPNHVTNLGLYANVPYDPVADFVPITYVASAQTVLVAHASTGLKTIQQLVDAAKAKPMALNYASSGAGTGTHLSMEMLMRATGTKLTHVSFRGATPAAIALVAGQVQAGFTTPPLVLSFIKDGRLAPLAVGGSKRLSVLPDVPSLADLGMLNYDFEVWFGLLAPKNTPAPVVGVLAKEIRRILSEPGIPEKFEVLGFTVVGSTPAEFDALIKKEVQRWPKLIRELGIQSGN